MKNKNLFFLDGNVLTSIAATEAYPYLFEKGMKAQIISPHVEFP